MPSTIRIGTVGTSPIMDMIIDAMKQTERMEVKVVYSRNIDRARLYAEKMQVPECCSDFKELVGREDLQVIYIASPNSCHYEQAIEAMQKGKSVIIEKPAACTGREIEQLHSVALENGVFFLEAITTIFMPNFQILGRLMPKLGRVGHASIKFGRRSSKYEEYMKGEMPNTFNPAMQGGALNDMGIYSIHTAVRLFGEPRRVLYEPILGENGVDLEGKLTLIYPRQEVEIFTSKINDIGSGLTIDAENGWYRQEGPLNDFSQCTAMLDGNVISADVQPTTNRMVWEMTAFRDCLFRKDKAFFERMYKQSYSAARVLEAAHRSVGSQEAVMV